MSKFLSSFLNLGGSFEKQKAVSELYAHLDTTPKSILGEAIKDAIKNAPVNHIIEWIKDFAKDNRIVTEDVIGEELLEKILNL